MGNSTERIPIKDLNDVIYYRQIKQYSDAEYNTSKDLKREKDKGHIVILEQSDNVRGSDTDQVQYLRERISASTVNAQDLKDAIREILPELNKSDLKGAVRDIAPMIVDMVRQELSKITFNVPAGAQVIDTPAQFQGPTYVPTVSAEGMVSNVEANKSETSSEAAKDALAALRRLNSK